MSTEAAAVPQHNSARRRGLTAIALAVTIAGLGWGGWYFLYGRDHVKTDDAYIDGDVFQITGDIAAPILAVHVDDTQSVHTGDALLELDPADAQIAMAKARQDLAVTVRQVSEQYAKIATLHAQISERQAAVSLAEGDLARRRVAARGSISAEDLAHAQDRVTQTHAASDMATAQLAEAETMTAGVDVPHHPDVLAAAARLRDAALALQRTRIVAPIDGVVAQLHVQPGQRVSPGTPLMAIIPLDSLWIDANFKEGQLGSVRVGQPATIRTDFYGNDVVFHGRVAGFSPGTGAAFALLPAQNATGNWIKIVQRLPVRIELNPDELSQHKLRIGLSATVDIDVRGPISPAPSRGYRRPSLPSALQEASTEQLIDHIIDANMVSDRTVAQQ